MRATSLFLALLLVGPGCDHGNDNPLPPLEVHRQCDISQHAPPGTPPLDSYCAQFPIDEDGPGCNCGDTPLAPDGQSYLYPNGVYDGTETLN